MPQTEIKKKLKQFLTGKSGKKSNIKAKNKFIPKMNFEYDEEADVLYASLGEPAPAESIDFDNGIILRLDPNSKKYVGFTIVNYMDRKKRGKIQRIPHFKQIELPNY